MPDMRTQTRLTGNRIEKALEYFRVLKQAKNNRTYQKKKRASKRMVERIVGAKATSAVAASQNLGGQNIKRRVVTKVTSAVAASSSPSAVPPQRFIALTDEYGGGDKVDDKVDDKVGDGDRWFV